MQKLGQMHREKGDSTQRLEVKSLVLTLEAEGVAGHSNSGRTVPSETLLVLPCVQWVGEEPSGRGLQSSCMRNLNSERSLYRCKNRF